MNLIEETISKIACAKLDKFAEAKKYIDKLAIPRGSLGRLEELALSLAEITNNLKPKLDNKVIFTMAGDHGVVERGVSAFPQEVTYQMVKNFVEGGASINAFSGVVGAKVVVVDMGVKKNLSEFYSFEGFIDKKVREGTNDFTIGSAMTRGEAVRSVTAGIEVASEIRSKYGLELAGTGDMGIGNTTPSSAVTSVITGIPVLDVTGRGTGISDEAFMNKVAVIEKGISVNKPNALDGIDVLAKVGGFEIGGIAGLIIGCASMRIPVVIDGFISTAGALIASKLSPQSTKYMIPSHQSVELGHSKALASMGLKPAYLNLGMRLGEGTGAALMFPFVEAAATLLQKIKTFECAEVTEQLN